MPGLDQVAPMARVDEVRVIKFLIGADRLRHEMIEIKIACYHSPLFPLQTVNAAKAKLITQPRPIRFVSSITARPMASPVALFGVVENQSFVSSRRIDNNFRCSALAPSIGKFASESTTARIVSVN